MLTKLTEKHTEVPFALKDQLSRDACTANDCKLTYGQLQARRHENDLRTGTVKTAVEMTREARLRNGWKACEYCGELFIPQTRNAKYCSVSCGCSARYYKSKAEKEARA